MQTFTSKGKNLEEAIELGLNLLNICRHEVDIEVIQNSTKGFFGIFTRPAIVNLTYDELNRIDESKSNNKSLDDLVDEFSYDVEDYVISQQSLKGKVWVENEEIRVIDSEQHYPTVKVGEGITLYRNNQAFNKETTILSEEDAIILDFEKEVVEETIWSLKLSKDDLYAKLKLKPGLLTRRVLKDEDPNTHINLSLEEESEPVNTLQYKDILREMESLGIKYGIDQQEIANATDALEPSEFIIAKGLPSTPGEHGKIEYQVEVNAKNGLEEDGNGRVNFREKKLIPSVEKGEVIAVIHPPRPGVPGVTVTNDPIPPDQTYPIKLKTGKGLIEVEDKIVATESGRPSFEKRGQLVKASIVPKLTHRGDVNISSGNIRFSGDVEIVGNVQENMLVDNDGDIFVHKSVNYATLITLSSILIKGNVSSSELSAGKNNMLIAELGHLLSVLHQEIERMMMYIKQLSDTPAFKTNNFTTSGLQPLIKILLEKRFNGFVSNVNKYLHIVEQGEKYLEKEWINIAIDLRKIFIHLSSKIITMDQLNEISTQMRELSEFSQLPVEPDAFITISEVNNSSLYCSGNINIIGKGSINTKIHSGGQLDVRGVIRGGEVYSRLGATVKEIGSSSGTKTVISVPDDQEIYMHTAYQGTVLKIGNVKRILYETYNNVKAILDHNSREIILVEAS